MDGRELGHLAADRAQAHAERETPGWHDMAVGVTRTYLAHLGPGDEFTTEHVRSSNIANRLPDPPDTRAWGNVMRALLATDEIAHAGFSESRNARAHGRPIRVWRKV